MKRSNCANLKHTLLERLVHYYYFVGEQAAHGESSAVTSTQIAELIHMDDTLVRKDLAAIGVRGYPHLGYKATEILNAIRDVLGFNRAYRAVVIGAGRLGGALASYRGFARYGMEIAGVFDADEKVVGQAVDSHAVRHMDTLPAFVRRENVALAVLTVPAGAAQEAADSAVAAGIRALWNFASASLTVPHGVFVRHEHISAGLAELSCHLKDQRREE